MFLFFVILIFFAGLREGSARSKKLRTPWRVDHGDDFVYGQKHRLTLYGI